MATSLFNLTKPLSGSVGASAWIDLGLIPTGFDFRINTWTCSGSKAISFYLYTNLATKSASGTANCKLLGTLLPKAGATLTQDLYKRGALLTKTVTGTGVEHWWIYMTAKSSTSGTYSINISYLQE